MNTCLIFPPNFAIDQPYLAVPALVAFLRQAGLRSIFQIDANIDSFHYFTKKEFLLRSIERIKRRLDDRSTDFDQFEYQQLIYAQIAYKPVTENIEAAIQYFKIPQKTTINEYHFYSRVLSKAFDIISAAYYPTEISTRDFDMQFSCQSSVEIFRATDSPENPYIDFYKETTIPKLKEIHPELVGVSIACMSQIIPSFTLAKLVKENFPETKIVFGGQVFNRLIDNVRKIPILFKCVDYFIDHEGETALLKLIRCLEDDDNLEVVPNLTYFDKDCQAPKSTGIRHIENMDDIPVPDFSDLNLGDYLSPEAVLPYQPVRGCYWHRCTFCNHFAVHPPEVRKRAPKDFEREIRILKERYDVKSFTIVNEGLEPNLLAEYAQSIISSNIDIEWYVGGRLDAKMNREILSTMKKSGCKKVYFGLESGSQKVLNDMRKGITLRHARRILSDCGDLDLAVHLFIMLGFPTETYDELENSKPVLYEYANLVSREGFTYYISIYQLKPCTCVFENPKKFSIKSVSTTKNILDLEYLYDFELEGSPPPGLDYDEQVKEIESQLDLIQGPLTFPENVVHYLSMRGDLMESPDSDEDVEFDSKKINNDSSFRVRSGLGFAKKADGIDHPEIQYLVYDLVHDSLFEIKDAAAWEALNRLPDFFKFDILISALEVELGRGNQIHSKASSIAYRLASSGLVELFTSVN